MQTKLYINKKMLFGFILAIIVIVVLGVVSFFYIEKLIAAGRSNSNSQRITVTIEQIRSSLTSLENVHLRFLLTENPEELKRYQENVNVVHNNINELISLSAPSSAQSNNAKDLLIAVDDKIDFLSEVQKRNKDSTQVNNLKSVDEYDFDKKIHAYLGEIQNTENSLKRKQQSVVTNDFYQFLFIFCVLLLIGLITPLVLMDFLNTNLKARDQAEEELKLVMASVHDLYENAPCGYFLIDHDGMITSMNKTLLRWLGYSREEVIDRFHISQLIATVPEEYKDAYSSLNGSNGMTELELEVTDKKKSVIPVIVNIMTVTDKNGKSVSRCSLIDNTQRKIAENESKYLNRELEAFSYSVSHDLRGPLRLINGYVNILKEDYGDKLDADGENVIRVISNNTQRMDQLINDLLHFSKIGRKEIVKTRTAMDAIVKPIIEELVEPDRHANVKLDLRLLGDSYVDVNLMRQVWINLISNALKYSQKKEVPRIEIGAYTDQGKSVYYVKDNGAGFNMEYVDKLFGVFQRLHKIEEFEGTGVGLALVKRIIDKHKGEVWVQAKENEGATFYFSIPQD